MACRRHFLGIALTVLVGASGCATRGRSSLASRPDTGLPPLPLKTAADVVDEINRNAMPVESLEAKANILASAPNGKKYNVDGQFALQRPRDFTLQVRSTARGQEANIGSNDQRFWLWTRESPKKEILICDYDAEGKAPLALGMQPDWIVEAMGLRVIPESEIANLKLTRGTGEHEGTYVLTHRMRGSDGFDYVRSTYLSQVSNSVVEHRMDVIKNGQVSPISQATISEYKTYDLPEGSGAERVKLPSKFKLSWFLPERMDMEITVLSASPNKAIDSARFEEPRYNGYTRVQLNDRVGMASESTVRETRPAPPSSSGMRLGAPQPLTPTPTSPRVSASLRGQGPLPMAPDLGGSIAPPGDVIGPRVPKPPGSETVGVPVGNLGRRPALYVDQ